MTTGARYYTPNSFEVDQNGVPGVGYQLFFYVTGTSTPQATYYDAAFTVPNPNPVVADDSGHFGSIFLTSTQAYKVACYTANPNPSVPSTPATPQGTQLWTEDPCGPAAGGVINATGIIGEIRQFAGISTSVPAGWYLCFGQPVSRSTYSAAFAVMGTTYGAGDGSTTFNLPDLRGRVLVGIDNMGGTAAGRITAGVSGVPGTTLGGTGGDQRTNPDTFTAVSTVTDPGHLHTSTAAGRGTSDSSNFLQGGVIWDLIQNVSTNSAITGITVATTVTGTLAGTAQNVQPSFMINSIIYLGA